MNTVEGGLDLMHLGASTDEVKTARDLLATRLAGWGHGELIEVGRVLTSELVSNAVIHGRAPITVEIRWIGDSVRVEVTDAGAGQPRRRPVSIESPGGMGLVIVANMATRWGVEPAPVGKTVWFELSSS